MAQNNGLFGPKLSKSDEKCPPRDKNMGFIDHVNFILLEPNLVDP